jgi:hypothetical protein
MKYSPTFFVESVILDLVEHVCQESQWKTLRGVMVHLDNARPHNSRESEASHIAAKVRRIPGTAYDPDLSPSDFFLFVMLKEPMSGTSYNSPDELISAISEMIASLPKNQLVSIYTNWMKRLNWMIKHRGSATASDQNYILLTAILTEIARYYGFPDRPITSPNDTSTLDEMFSAETFSLERNWMTILWLYSISGEKRPLHSSNRFSYPANYLTPLKTLRYNDSK